MGGMYMNDNFENMYDNMNNMEFEEPEFEMEDGMGYGMGTMGMGAMGMGGVAGMNGMGMNGMAMTGANMGMSGAMGMGAGMGAGTIVAPGATVVRHVTTGVVPGTAAVGVSPASAVYSRGVVNTATGAAVVPAA